MNIVAGQKYMNGCLVTFTEREFFLQAMDQNIITYIQGMKDRKVNLQAVSFLISLLFCPLFISDVETHPSVEQLQAWINFINR